jgi:hypothetical protein
MFGCGIFRQKHTIPVGSHFELLVMMKIGSTFTYSLEVVAAARKKFATGGRYRFGEGGKWILCIIRVTFPRVATIAMRGNSHGPRMHVVIQKDMISDG